MAMRGVRDADVSFNDILHAYNFTQYHYEALDGRAGTGGYRGVKTSL